MQKERLEKEKQSCAGSAAVCWARGWAPRGAGAVFVQRAAPGGLHEASASALLWAASPGRREWESRGSPRASFLVLLYLFLEEDEDKLSQVWQGGGLWGYQAADHLSPLVTGLYIFSLCSGHESSGKQGKIFCEETAFRIKIPWESNYMFNNLRYYFRRYKTERTAYCFSLTSSSLFFLFLFICFFFESAHLFWTWTCFSQVLKQHTLYPSDHWTLLLLHFYHSWMKVYSLGYIYSVTLGTSTCSWTGWWALITLITLISIGNLAMCFSRGILTRSLLFLCFPWI